MPLEDLEQASRLLVEALHIRDRYMDISNQTFPAVTARFLREMDNVSSLPHSTTIVHEDKKTIAGKSFFSIPLFYFIVYNIP